MSLRFIYKGKKKLLIWVFWKCGGNVNIFGIEYFILLIVNYKILKDEWEKIIYNICILIFSRYDNLIFL